MRAAVILFAFIAAINFVPVTVEAQEATDAQSDVLLVDPERMFTESAFGRRVKAELEQSASLLAAENRQIEANLIAEERSLTERRAAMTVEAFRAEANSFDQRVQRIRTEQEAKAVELQRYQESERQRFLQAIRPVLERFLSERGAVMMIDRRGVFVSLDSIDITDEVIAGIDEEIGEGTAE